MLQHINSAIDAVHGAKHQFINTFINQEAYKKAWQEYVDAQSAFAKQAVKTTYTVGSEAVKAVQKFDFTELHKAWK